MPKYIALLVFSVFSVFSSATNAGQIVEGRVETDLVPGPVEFSALLPVGYQTISDPLPLLIYLHGGGMDRSVLNEGRAFFEDMWAAETLPRMVVVTPSVGPFCQYLDYYDGSQKWETFLVKPFLSHIRRHFNVSKRRKRAFVAGWSMGGLGALRLAFKHPETFSVVLAFEPQVYPALSWKDVHKKNRFWLSDRHFETLFGKPVDESYWRRNEPAAIVQQQHRELRETGLRIFLECGNEDSFNLHEGTEFLHRVLWRKDIPHEYHVIDGADHLGRSVDRRFDEGLRFLAVCLESPKPDAGRRFIRNLARKLKQQGGLPGAADPKAPFRRPPNSVLRPQQ